MNTTSSQYMDKKIMDGFSSETAGMSGNNTSSSNNDFIDFTNGPLEKKGDLVPTYNFISAVQPAVGYSSAPADRSSNLYSADDDAPIRASNSTDPKINSSPIRNYGSVDADEPANFILGKNENLSSNATSDVSLVSKIDKTMEKYMDNLVHALDSLSARLSQLETRTRNLENSIDDLKVSVGNNHGDADGKFRFLGNILREVQSDVLIIKDKQEILEARLEITKVQASRVEQEAESKKIAERGSTTAGVTAAQHIFTVAPPQPQPQPMASSSNVPQPPKQQNLQPQAHLPDQFPQNQLPFVPQQPKSCNPSPSQTLDNPSQKYQIPPPLPPHQYQSSPPLYSQPPSSSQPRPLLLPFNPAIPQPQWHTYPEETPCSLPQNYPPITHLPPSQPPTGVSPSSQQYYRPYPNVYKPPSSHPGPGYPGPSGPSGHGEPYPYRNSPSQHGSSSSVKLHQFSPAGIRQDGGTDYSQLPTARILPQALPTASPISELSGSGGSENKAPNDDIVNRVTNMGFPRDQVLATVRRLTESGQAVDLNVVLDKLMNDG